MGRMRLGGRHELRKVWVGDERTGGVENHGGSMRSRPLRIDEVAEIVELEICGDNSMRCSPQRCTHGYHWSADTERNVGR